MKTIIASIFLSLSTPAFAAPDFVKLVSVRGEGEIRIKPDKASVNLQVRTKAKDAKSAQAKNAKEMARVEKLLRDEFKIDAKDIQTLGFYVNPEYRYEQNGKQTFLGYQVDHNLTVTIKKIDKLGALFDGLIGKGSEDIAVLLQGVTFDTERRQEVEIQALEAGMKRAQARAEALAKFAKRSIKGVLRISDSSVSHSPPPFPLQRMKTAMAMDVAESETQISPGEIVVSSQVSVDYEID